MKLSKKIAVTLGVIAVGVSLAIAVIFIYPGDDMCGNKIYFEALSPDKEHKVVVFHRDCGATTGFSTQISIVGVKDDLKDKSGNIFIINGHH